MISVPMVPDVTVGAVVAYRQTRSRIIGEHSRRAGRGWRYVSATVDGHRVIVAADRDRGEIGRGNSGHACP